MVTFSLRTSQAFSRDYIGSTARVNKTLHNWPALGLIVGYPTETEADWFEFLEDLATADEGLTKLPDQWGIELHSTPFRPMPATPCACWPMSPVNYRGRIVKVLAQGKHREYHGIFHRGNRFCAAESRGTESLPTVILDSLVLRGVEDDSEVIARLATSVKFRGASMAHKTAILERHVDVGRLFGAYTWNTLPTRYVAAYTPADKLKNMDAVARNRAGAPWPANEGASAKHWTCDCCGSRPAFG